MVNSNLTSTVVKTHSDSDGGAFVTVTGSGDPDGGFAVVGVPGGAHYLQLGNLYVLTPHDALDFGVRQMGRPAQKLAPNPTALTLNASGLSPWAPSDVLSLSCTNLGVKVQSIESLGATEPTAGATSAQLALNWAQGDMRGLVESAAGDTLVLTQSRAVALPATHWVATSSATITGLTQLAGQSSIANAVFTPLPSTQATLDWRVTQFEAFKAAVHPNATVAFHQLLIQGVAAQGALGVSGSTHALLHMNAAAGAADVAGPVQFGNPFSNTLEPTAAYSTVFSVMVQAPGATAAAHMVGINRTVPLATMAGPINPGLSPPRNLTVNGVPVTQPIAGATTTPVIGWTPPALGTPDCYLVTVYRLSNVAGATQISPMGSVRLKGTKVRIPPGLPVAGNTYVLNVAATLAGGGDVELKPFTTGRTLDHADAVVGPLTP